MLQVSVWPETGTVILSISLLRFRVFAPFSRVHAEGGWRGPYLGRAGLPRPRTTGPWSGVDRPAVSSKFTPSGPRQALLLPFLLRTGWLHPTIRHRVRPYFASGGRWNLARMSGRSLTHWCVLLCCIAGLCGSVLALQSTLSWQLPKPQQIRKCALQLRNLKQASCPRTVLKIMCTAAVS